MLLFPILRFLALAATAAAELRVVPEPTSHSEGNTTLCLHPSFKIKIEGGSAADLSEAAKTVQDRLSSAPLYLSPTHGSEFSCGGELRSLVLRFTGPAKPIAVHAQERLEKRIENEAYTLSMPVNGPAVITAQTSIGLYRGLTTFENLLYSALPGPNNGDNGHHGNGHKDKRGNAKKQVYAPFAPYEIKDRPAFGWRAVLLDSSRHYLSLDVIRRQLDAMAAVKINVFHWHIVDSQSFPLKFSGELGALADNAAYSPAKIYTEDDVRRIVDYAGARGIDVVIEIDTPGHTAAVYNTFPELIAGFVRHPWSIWANEPPSGQLRFADPATISFTRKMFKQTLGLLKSPYFGTGGDEINAVCVSNDTQTADIYAANGWSFNFTTKAESDATLSAALRPFTEQTHEVIREIGRTPVVWDEMAIEFDSGIGNDTLIQAWRGPESTAGVINKGFRVIMADYNYFYLDCGQGGWVTGNPEKAKTGNINSWCDPYKTWMKALSYDPYLNLTSDAQKELVVGGQASLWAEQTDANNIEAQLWPRAAAFAEVFWSGGGQKGFPRDPIAAVGRMHDVRYRLDARGIRSVPIQPEWCAMRPGECLLE
ncbi:hypothetical protein CspHIS471_0105140 [Cutaneotrichosporon sp. HIS471]|nr:hypothetical protein CspHIS471_0105140 [Cutaneotrichosporon sp. HIS471]